jgi:hypothetical protein
MTKKQVMTRLRNVFWKSLFPREWLSLG